jgi:hypothetical protein
MAQEAVLPIYSEEPRKEILWILERAVEAVRSGKVVVREVTGYKDDLLAGTDEEQRVTIGYDFSLDVRTVSIRTLDGRTLDPRWPGLAIDGLPMDNELLHRHAFRRLWQLCGEQYARQEQEAQQVRARRQTVRQREKALPYRRPGFGLGRQRNFIACGRRAKPKGRRRREGPKHLL